MAQWIECVLLFQRAQVQFAHPHYACNCSSYLFLPLYKHIIKIKAFQKENTKSKNVFYFKFLI